MICHNCPTSNVWPPRLRIVYVDGAELEGTVEDWSKWRAEGVSYIDVGTRQHAGHSFYWLYTENITQDETAWVSGAFSLHSREAHECIHRENGETLLRTRRDLPDLFHNQVKLGWWWK